MGARKQRMAALTPTAHADVVVAAGAAPTKAEFDAVVAAVNELKHDLNAAVAALQK